jgi:hypothetical protein
MVSFMHRPLYPRNESSVRTGHNAGLKPAVKRKTSVPVRWQIQILSPPGLPEILAVLSPILDSKTKLCYGYIITFSTLNLQLCVSQAKKKNCLLNPKKTHKLLREVENVYAFPQFKWTHGPIHRETENSKMFKGTSRGTVHSSFRLQAVRRQLSSPDLLFL